MTGTCPGCGRTYEISAEFVKFGGQAKCPHCMLFIQVDETSFSVREIDAHCPSCRRYYKIDWEYLQTGGLAKCPHCEVDLSFEEIPTTVEHPPSVPPDDLYDEPSDPDQASTQIGSSQQGSSARCTSDLQNLFNDFSEEIPAAPRPTSIDSQPGTVVDLGPQPPPEKRQEKFELPELRQLFSHAQPPEQASPGAAPNKAKLSLKDLGLDDLSWAGETASLPVTRLSSPAPVGEPADLPEFDTPDEDPFASAEGEESTVLVDPATLFPTDSDETNLELAAKTQAVAETSRIAFDSLPDLSETNAEEYPTLEPGFARATPVGAPAGHPQVDSQKSGDLTQPFSQLVSSDQWAKAASKWVDGGDRSDKMPDFPQQPASAPFANRETNQPPKTHASTTQPTEEADDILPLDDGDVVALDESHPPKERLSVRPLASVPTDVKPESRRVVPTRKEKLNHLRAHLANPPILGAFLVGLLALIALVFWLVLGNGENPDRVVFPTEQLAPKTAIHSPSPSPSAYPAQPESLEHYAFGNRLAYLGRFDEAREEYNLAKRADVNNPLVYRALGALYAALGKPQESMVSYEQYLRLAPQAADANQVRDNLKRYYQNP